MREAQHTPLPSLPDAADGGQARPGRVYREPLIFERGAAGRSGASLPDNLRREIHEECGIDITVGPPCLVNEFHDPDSGFHQVDIYFRCTPVSGLIPPDWRDPEGIVTERRFVTREELATLRHKPDSLGPVAWGEGLFYDPLEVIVR